jgi:lipopolysaccharide/colanic/teichoic acid biosynthesis glycosyltransferase
VAVPTQRQLKYLRVKRIADVVLVLAVLPVVVPLIALIGLAILVTTGRPVFFKQQRTGRDGVRFRMLKFSSMVPNAEELKAQLAHLNVLPPPDFKIPNDPRVTRIGRFLRKSSLDELPQLFNVLRGEMTLVGPRPTSFAPSTYEIWHTARLEVPPGITGLWQLNGRGEISFDERLRLDIDYIKRMSAALDLKIMLGTVASMFKRKGL